ncbi:MAG: serine hydrolase domain-containing protein [Gemmatimonadota bacterium]
MTSCDRQERRRLRSGAVTVGLLVGLVGVSPAAAQVTTWQSSLDDFGAQLASDVVNDDAGGIAAGVVVDGDLVWAEAWGWADRDRDIPMTPAAISRTGSISKTVTAVLLMALVDRGVVGLDDPVRDAFPEVEGLADARPGAAAITYRHLASHTAGLVREPDWRGSVVGPIELWEERILESIPLTAYDSVPGARYQYSNIGYGVLGLALSRAAGRPFMELVDEVIFEPLGMTGSDFIVVGAELEPRLARGYSLRDGVVSGEQPAREHAGRGYKVPNGGVYSTVADLGRFLGALAGVPGLRILSEESRQRVLTVQTPESDERGYGLGVQLVPVGDRLAAAHGGSVAGYNAYMVVEPHSGIGVILLRNYTGGSTNLGGVSRELLSALVATGAR